MPIDLYYTPGSGPCRAVQLTAKLLGIDLNLKHLDLTKKEQLAPEFVKLNPQHTVPTLVDNGLVIWQSSAIITYLVSQYAKDDSLYPKDAKKKAVVNQRLYFNVGTILPCFSAYYPPLFMGTGVADAKKFAEIEEAFEFLNIFLEGHEFVAGDKLTVADISLVTTVATFDVAGFNIYSYKNVASWYDKLQVSLPGYQEINGKEILSKLFEKLIKK